MSPTVCGILQRCNCSDFEKKVFPLDIGIKDD